MIAKAIHAGSASTSSFDEASAHLRVLAKTEVSAKRIGRRLVTRIGGERIAQVQQQSRELENLPLPDQRQSPVPVTPELVCIQVDGGRLQIRDQKASPDKSDAGDSSSTFWRESKVAVLLKLKGEGLRSRPLPYDSICLR